ncbi:MAG: pirin family protein [Actinomycetota bacterium]|nr:pirin family protein [Actinomycetota bacterium]
MTTVQRADARFVTRGDGWEGRYCFSYGEHYDPANISFGALLACNEFVLDPGAGFGLHDHSGVDIVTVVLEGELTHVGPAADPVLRAGESRRIRTEGGIEHDERNEGTAPLRFVQAWLRPGTEPWLHLVTGSPGVTGGQEQRIEGPAFVFCGYGEVTVDDEVLSSGDSVRSERSVTVSAGAGAAALVWALP